MKVGDKILHKTKDRFADTIIQSNFDTDGTYQIKWDRQMWNTGPNETWVFSHAIELDITQIRHDKLNQLL